MRMDYIPSGAVAVVPTDVAPALGTVAFTGLYVGVAGDITIVDSLGRTTLFKAVPQGAQIFAKIASVKITGTTATNIVGYLA